MNTPVKVIATKLDKNRGNVCVSRRAVLEKSKNKEITEALKNIKVNDIVEDGNYVEKILKNAPDSKEGFFTTIKVIE